MEDAEVLKELYETIKQNSKADYAGIIEQRASYPYLYHLSQIRENLVSFLPFDKDMRVLECNPECGALTGKLLAMTGGVTVLAESELQEKILRERFMEPQERERVPQPPPGPEKSALPHNKTQRFEAEATLGPLASPRR